MADINIPSSLDTILTEMKDSLSDINTAVSKASLLKGYLTAGNWTGKTKETCISMYELTEQYHDDVKFLVESLKKHVSELEKNVDQFPDISGNMSELRNT